MNRTPIGMMMDLAKKEIGSVTQSIMSVNHIPVDLMIYILESVTNDLSRLKHVADAEEYTEAVKEIEKNMENPEVKHTGTKEELIEAFKNLNKNEGEADGNKK